MSCMSCRRQRIVSLRIQRCISCDYVSDRDQFQLATLSHLINNKAAGYQELSEWPEEAPDPSVRNVEVPMPWADTKTKEKKKPEKKKSFYSDEDTSSAGQSLHLPHWLHPSHFPMATNLAFHEQPNLNFQDKTSGKKVTLF